MSKSAETEIASIEEQLKILRNKNTALTNFLLGLVSATEEDAEKKAPEQSQMLLENKKEEKKKLNVNPKPRKREDLDLKNISYRLSDNRYCGRKRIKGIKFEVYGRTQKECYEKLQREIKNYFAKNKKETTKKAVTFIELYDKWYIQDKEKFVAESTKSEILMVKRRCEELHQMNIKKITKDILIEFLNKLPENRIKEKIIIYLRSFFKSLVLDSVIPVSPFNNLKTAPIKHKSKKAFTYEQQKLILEELKGTDLEKVILVYLITGMRKNEFEFYKIDKQIDMKTQILRVLNLKGRNLEKRYKNIKLSKKAISFIMNNIDVIKKFNEEKCYREFAKVLKKLNINGAIVTCRHTFATNCFYLGKPQLVISREMGHSTTSITEKVFTDIDYNLSKEKIIKLYNDLYNLE